MSDATGSDWNEQTEVSCVKLHYCGMCFLFFRLGPFILTIFIHLKISMTGQFLLILLKSKLKYVKSKYIKACKTRRHH